MSNLSEYALGEHLFGEQLGIVIDGLVLYFDGINNTGAGHSNSATVWKNLAGIAPDGKITGATWADDHLIFDGNDYVSIGQFFNNYQTVEAVVSFDAVGSTQWGQEVISSFQSGGLGLYQSYGYPCFCAYIAAYTYAKSSNLASTNTKLHLCGTFDGSVIRLYINALLVAETTKSGLITPPGTTYVMLGANPNGSSPGGDYLQGKIYSARMYFKGLTAAEVEQNFAYEQRRYGL